MWFYVLYFPNAFMNVITRLLVVKWKTLRFSGKKAKLTEGMIFAEKMKKKKKWKIVKNKVLTAYDRL